jgi:peptidoglycan/xylan/chitin deacetylase (PgdA/CDA1 family)
MWEVLSADYDQMLSPEQVWQRVARHTKPGSILLFHDSLKAKDRVLPVLERLLEHYSNMGYTFLPLTYELITGARS